MTSKPEVFLLLRGLTREQGHWGQFTIELQGHFPTAKIITPDLPGNGINYQQQSTSSIAALVDQLRDAVISELHGKSVCVIALSLGAMATLEWLSRYPGELQSAVLMSTSLRGVSPFYHRLRPTAYSKLLRVMFCSRDLSKREDLIYQLTCNGQHDRDAVVAQWCELARRHPVSRMNALRQLWAAACYHAPAHKPDVPIMLLAGMADALVDPRCSQALARDWQLPLKYHAGAGHDLPLDVPEWCCDKITAWLNDCSQ